MEQQQEVTNAARSQSVSTESEVQDLGEDKPMQVKLLTFRSSVWVPNALFRFGMYDKWEWLEYSVNKNAAFCYPCRKFSFSDAGQGIRKDDTFTKKGYTNWKHATEKNKGFYKHADSLDDIDYMKQWKEKELRCHHNAEISTLVNFNQVMKNRYYFSALIEIVQFLALHQLPLRGNFDAFDDKGNVSSGLFMSLLDFSIKKDSKLAEWVKTIPKNATYTSHEIQDELIAVMKEVLTDEIVREVGEAWYTLLVDGMKDDVGVENVSIVIRFYNEETHKVLQRLLVMTTSLAADAKTLTEVVCSKLEAAGLKTTKILS